MNENPQLERIVARQVRGALEKRHWRVIRNSVTKVQWRPGQWTPYGEPGMPDFQAIYYLHPHKGITVTVWVETKKLGGGLGEEQVKWQREERKRGGIVLVSYTFQEFLTQYEQLFGWLHQPPFSRPGHQLQLEKFGEELVVAEPINTRGH
jgi:hypothetical protein